MRNQIGLSLTIEITPCRWGAHKGAFAGDPLSAEKHLLGAAAAWHALETAIVNLRETILMGEGAGESRVV